MTESDAMLDLLADLTDALSRAERSLNALDPDYPHRARGGEADEEHAIRIAEARLNRARAMEMRSKLTELRAQVDEVAQRSRATRDGSQARTEVVRRRREQQATQPDSSDTRPEQAGDQRPRWTIDTTVVLGVLETASETLHVGGDIEQTLRTIVTAALRAVPSAQHAGVSLREGTRISARAPSDPLVAQIDLIQTELSEGPCVDAVRQEEAVLVNDLGTADERWPGFAPRARALGVFAIASFPLITSSHKPNGALNLHATRSGMFTDDDVVIGQLFAVLAALALEGAVTAQGLHRALASRDVIGQAKGILMARRGIDAEQAWHVLRNASQDTNLKLIDVARWTVRTLGKETPGKEAEQH